MPRPALVVGLCAGVLLLAGCGDDRPTVGEGGTRLSAAMAQAHVELQRDVVPLVAWRATDTAAKDEGSGCGRGEARRGYTATLDIPDSQSPDAPTHALQVLGGLGSAGWDAKLRGWTTTSATVTATRSKKDGTGSRLTLELSSVQGGWHYALAARTACLPTSG